jgi:hypothetical protein
MKGHFLDTIKYYLEMTGLFLAMVGMILLAILLCLPIILFFAVAVVSMWKLLLLVLAVH